MGITSVCHKSSSCWNVLNDFEKQTSSIKGFNVGTSNNTPMKSKQQYSCTRKKHQSHLKSNKEANIIKPPNMALQASSNTQQASKSENAANNEACSQQAASPSLRQQKQYFRQAGPSNSKRLAVKNLEVKLTLIRLI